MKKYEIVFILVIIIKNKKNINKKCKGTQLNHRLIKKKIVVILLAMVKHTFSKIIITKLAVVVNYDIK